jgi:hypothetical protein
METPIRGVRWYEAIWLLLVAAVALYASLASSMMIGIKNWAQETGGEPPNWVSNYGPQLLLGAFAAAAVLFILAIRWFRRNRVAAGWVSATLVPVPMYVLVLCVNHAI